MRWLLSQLLGNFGIVHKRTLYRSAQRWIILWFVIPWLAKHRNLKTVINLAVSKKDKQDAYERKVCAKHGLKLIEYPSIAPPPWKGEGTNVWDAIEALMDSLHRGALLVHCEGGTDRTFGVVGWYMKTVMEWPNHLIEETYNIYGKPGWNWVWWFYNGFPKE